MRLIAALGLCVTAFVPATAYSATSTHSLSYARAYILQSERQWIATNPAELALVKRIVADDFVWVDHGKLLDKAAAMKDAAAGPGDVASERIDSLNVRFYGDTAIATGRNVSIYKNGRKSRGAFIDTWMLRNGEWQIISSADMAASQKTSERQSNAPK